MQAKERTGPAGPAETAQGGFTLVEILVVVILLGLMASIAVPRIDRAQFEVTAGAQEIMSTLVAAKHMAVLKGHDVVLAFDTTKHRVRVHSDRNSNGSVEGNEDVRLFEFSSEVGFGKGGAPAWGAYTYAVNLTQSQDGFPSLTFHRNGSASEETRFYVSSYRAVRNGGFPDDARAFDVQRSTGTISCRSYSTEHDWRRGC